jgi:hypothetical protein
MMQKWDDNIKVKDLLCSFATLVPIFFQVYNAHAVLQHFLEREKKIKVKGLQISTEI